MSVQTGAIALVSWLMLFLFFRSGRKAGSYLLTSADDADDADDAELAKTLLPTEYESEGPRWTGRSEPWRDNTVMELRSHQYVEVLSIARRHSYSMESPGWLSEPTTGSTSPRRQSPENGPE
jgi:hypothetical protein